MPIVRIVTNGQPPEIPRAGERMMLTALGPRWPTNVRAKFLITPGGFVVARWPQGLEPRTGWQSRPSDLAGVTRHAAEVLKKVVTPRVLDAAKARAAILTIGIDVVGGPGGAMAELVAVFDVSRGQLVRWTGKSYPTPGRQERDLVHVADLKSHLLKVAGERVLVLGCHDLNMFSRRAHANQAPTGPRRQRCDAMRSEVARFEPTVVLQHPHTTDTPNIWRATWMTLAKEVPSAKSWASGIAYFNWGKARRASLDRVLSLTRSDPEHVRDIVLKASHFA